MAVIRTFGARAVALAVLATVLAALTHPDGSIRIATVAEGRDASGMPTGKRTVLFLVPPKEIPAGLSGMTS
jgi:hypothetical protein